MTRLAIMVLLFAMPGGQGKEEPKPPAAPPPRFAVVVHTDNKLTETGDAAKTLLKKLFLKELTRWPDGGEAKAYARTPDAECQIAFRKVVLEMSEAELARHWLKQKSMNGSTPPKEVEADRLVLKYVAKNANAFGIVTLESAKPATGIKVVFEF